MSVEITAQNTAEVNLGVLCANYRKIKAAAGGSRVICVVKADAYGHGAARCASALNGCGADFFGVANLCEAIERRKAGIAGDILILGYTAPADAPFLIEHGIIQTVFSLDYARVLSGSIPAGHKLRCHLKLDTDMNRIGFNARDGGRAELDDMAAALSLPGLDFCGVFTHFACADDPSSPMTEAQFERFCGTVAALEARGAHFEVKHAANSAAIINFPRMRLDAVRAGIILYGFRPSPLTGTGGCAPVMTLRTTVSHIHELRPGESVSYGATYIASHPVRLATLSIGYADGFVRAYAGHGGRPGAGVYFGDRFAPIVGRICMDQCMTDVTGIGGIKPGMRATVFDAVHTADLLAEAASTINYEVTSILTRRVKRIYI